MFETDPLMMVYESSVLDFPAMRKISDDVQSSFLQDPSNASIGRVSFQVIEVPDGMLFCLFYAREFFTQEHIDRFHGALAHYVEKLGGSMTVAR